MSYQFQNLTVSKLSVIGAGQIGPDITLHFSKVFVKHGVKLVLVDIAEEALARAKTKIEKKIDKGVDSGAFKPEMAEKMKAGISYTLSYDDIAGSEIVLEAATEDGNIKDGIFRQVETICDDNCLFLSNSSHMQPEVIFKSIVNKSRCLVTHYFFPAERNPVVEIIPSSETSTEITETLLGFYESIGKVPVEVKSSYGYAIDPIFEGLCQTAILCLERGFGSVKEIDKVATEVLGLGVGPFTALNLTGGNPITDHGLDEMHDLLMPWFKSPQSLREATRSGEAWPTAGRGENVDVPSARKTVLAEQFLGAYFSLAGYIIDLGICDASSLDMACEIALVVKPPFSTMNEMGLEQSLSLVKKFCADHDGFVVPQSIEQAAVKGEWKLSRIVSKVVDGVAVFTIRRPKVLNALHKTVMSELQALLEAAEKDSAISGSVITGFGTKAFVSGADINELATYKTPEQGYQSSQTFQAVLNYIENLQKPVVCAFNGFAFGGGNELAMACTARICKKNLPVLVCQPEVNLGFIPGAGGTQRLPRLIGLEKAQEILRTGRPVSSAEALKCGLVLKEVDGDLVAEAVTLVQQISQGNVKVTPICKTPFGAGEQAPAINIGHLSKRIDEILIQAIYDGAQMSLQDGLELESRLFGECVKTKDMWVGVDNFMKNGPRVKAEFVHK